MASVWGQTPNSEKISIIPLLISSPKILTTPEVFDNAAVTILNVVDFPAPFGPNKPKI